MERARAVASWAVSRLRVERWLSSSCASRSATSAKIGKAVASDEESYRYLVESIRRFPKPGVFRTMVANAGFVRAAAEPMLGGLVTIHSGWKI